MQAFSRLLQDVASLLFPKLCCACGESCYAGEKEICTACLADLPFTDFHQYPDNPVAKQFWGRLPLEAAMAMLYFKKGSKVQRLMHHLKYKDRPELGTYLGKLLGQQLLKAPGFATIDYIIPVPLHPRKEHFRGYNQSLCIATGLTEVLQKPVDALQLIRKKSTASQTRKSRFTRYENMQTVFEVLHPNKLIDTHILLVDDVVTTGATLEACGTALFKHGINKLSVACVAFSR